MANSTEIEVFLRDIWAFKLLEPEQLRSLSHLVLVRKLAAEEVLWLQGQNVSHFSIVFNGRLRTVRRSSSGAEKKLSTLSRGRHFGLAEMITGVRSTVTIIADMPSTILVIDRKSLRNKLLSDVDICYRLMQTMARAIFDLTGELERASFENVHTRLARLLIKKHHPNSSPHSGLGTDKCNISLTHEELAVLLGVSRETVSRVISDFRRQGLIKTAYRSITIINTDGLKRYIEDYEEE